MSAVAENLNYLLMTCVEGFFYGLYTGIFVIYLQCQSIKSTGTERTSTILFYAICLLYVLSTLDFVCDLIAVIFESRVNYLGVLIGQSSITTSIFRVGIVQVVASGGCDFLAQCILIYRCWIVWGQNIRVVIIPSFLAVVYLATWVVPVLKVTWIPLTTTSFAATMAVNCMVTGLIVFKITSRFSEVKAASTSVERSLGSTGDNKFRHVIFVIIESGMMLLVIQLVSIVLYALPYAEQSYSTSTSLAYVLSVGEMLDGITPTLIFVRVSMKLSFDDEESFKEAVGSLCFNNPPSDPNTLQRVESMLPEDSERNEDDCFNNSSSDPNIL